MRTTVFLEPPANPDPFVDYPALARCRLEAGDLHELGRQGFLAVEQRGDHIIHKLRFRRGGRQVVRSIGDSAVALAVAAELHRLQSTRRIRRELAALDRVARKLLRDAKAQLEPLVNAVGWKFHGRAVRRPHPISGN